MSFTPMNLTINGALDARASSIRTHFAEDSEDSAGEFSDSEDEEEARMYVNGESAAQMEHVRAIKNAGGVSLNSKFGSDTSKDQDWKIDKSSAANWADRYVLFITVLWLLPKVLVFAIPMLILHLVPTLIARMYMSSFPAGTVCVRRNKAFYTTYVICLLTSLPAMLLVILSLLLDYVAYYVFGLLYCAVTCRWKNWVANWEKVRPYSNGPNILFHLPDLFVAVMGQCMRHGCGVAWYMMCCMWIIMPTLKYWVNCNTFAYDLDHRLCQQISTTMKDLDPENDDQPSVADVARIIISWAKQTEEQWERIDKWSFVPHYPFPPPGRRWALGIQAGGGECPGRFFLIVHTTHAIAEAKGFTGYNQDDHFVLSNSCDEPIYRVMLWYNNPFHFLTGWVEASISNGKESQYPDKFHGGEHPMWLVTGRTSQIAGRDSFTGSGMIDAFFDYWLPVFVHEMRHTSYLHRHEGDEDVEAKAEQYADEEYQQVYSADGVSKAMSKKGLDKYENSAMDDYNRAGGKSFNRAARKGAECLNHFSDTGLGRRLYELQKQ